MVQKKLLSELDGDNNHVVMFRYSPLSVCLALLLASWLPPTALAAPLPLPQSQQTQQTQTQTQTQSQTEPQNPLRRQYDPNDPRTTGPSNVVVGVLSAVAAVIALAAVILLLFFPETTKRIVRPMNMTMMMPPVEPPTPLKPEITTTTVTTVTHSRRTSSNTATQEEDASRQVSARTSVGMFAGGRRGLSVNDRLSKIGLAVSDASVYDDDGSSSIYSQSESDFDLEKCAAKLVTRPPSSVVAPSSRYSCHVSANYSDSHSHSRRTTSSWRSRVPSSFVAGPRASSHPKPISWLRFSSSTSTPTKPRPAMPPRPHPPVSATLSDEWPRPVSPSSPSSLASRRGKPMLKHIRVPS